MEIVMNAQDGEELQRRLLEDNLCDADKEELLHAFRYQAKVSELEARLRGGHDFDDIVNAALVATREFYNANNVLLANTDLNLQIVGSVVRELPRKGFKPFCGSEPLDLTNYPKFSEMIGLEQPVACSDLTGLSSSPTLPDASHPLQDERNRK